MADHDDWTADDDAQLRAALGSLRADVEGAPLPDVRFVKARGMARRRQRLFSWTAAAAAAAVVVGTVGYSQFGRDASLETPPATRSSTTSAAPSPTTTDSIGQPGALPLLQEWTRALDLKGTARMTTQDPKSADWASFECLTSIPQGQKLRQEVTLDAGGFQGGQTQFAVSSKLHPDTVAEGIASDIRQCQQGPDFAVTGASLSGDLHGPYRTTQIFSYTAGDAGSGWFVVVPGPSDVTLIQIIDAAHPKSVFTVEQVVDLAQIAKDRLKWYGSGAAPTTPATTTSTSSGPKAIDQVMQITGPAPVPASKYFIAASQWSDPLLGPGGKTYAGQGNPGDTLGDIGVFCETKDFLSGFGGRLGEVEIQSGPGDGNVIGHQRVRIDDADTSTPEGAALAKQSVTSQLAQEESTLVRGCTEPDGKVTTTTGPTDGTFLLTKKVTGDASGTDYRWVGVTPLATPGAWTTIVFHQTSDGQGFQGTPKQAFAELDRLLALARQK
ncbi:hypothetical protein [Pedococcus bigeumensis]|uniref:Uncharacterized protein n=1 Tax=Pedococcus bigeumensis TaxID=433644 RepID=A0A502D4X9_9MICO|nr:hypothetical protein [Pedococcus bigeumensis]TPG19071.1 hypothetical protein EAH86_00700 [Pedococcus bigeumensis]